MNTAEKLTIEPHTRTIYFNYYQKLGLDDPIKKYKLNLPKMVFEKYDFNDGSGALNLKIYNSNNKSCVIPFPNSDLSGIVCIGCTNPDLPLKDRVAKFFNTAFYRSSELTLDFYVKKQYGEWYLSAEAIDKFYKKWEKTGKLKLVKLE